MHGEPGEEERERAVSLIAEDEEGGGRRRERRRDGDVGSAGSGARGHHEKLLDELLDERMFAR